MACATYTATRRGHQVNLCEKEDELGGILKSEQALPFKYEMYPLSGTYEKLARDAGVDELRNAAPFVRVIGDAAKVSAVTNAVYWGCHAAPDI